MPTERVGRFLGDAGLIEKPALVETPVKSRPKARAQERLKAAEEAARAAARRLQALAEGDQMSLKIRLARGGAKKRPYYSIVVADSRSPRDGRFIEKLGTYNPMLDRSHADRVTLKAERVQHWLGVGALPTDRIARFLGDAGLIEKPAIHETPVKSRPKARAQERLKAAEDAAGAAAGRS